MSEITVSAGKEMTVFTGMSVVLTANELNLSIFKPVWLCQSNILKSEELGDGVLISPAAIQIPCPTFQLVIVPNRLQLTFPDTEVGKTVEPVNRVLGGILKTLPHTPLVGIGMNFDFFVAPASGISFEKWNAEHFSSKAALDTGCGVDGQPRFGAYFSLLAEGMRLKVDAKPVSRVVASPQIMKCLEMAPEWMHFAFNYHKDLDQSAPTAHALDLLSKWSAVVSHARSTIGKIFP